MTSEEQEKTISEERRHRVTEKLEENHARRAEEREKRVAERAEQLDPSEDPGLFHSHARNTSAKVKAMINNAVALSKNDPKASAKDGSEAKSTLDQAHEMVRSFSKTVAESAHFLPTYDLRQAQEMATTMENDIAEARKIIAPKKKFSFSSRRAAKTVKSSSGAASKGDSINGNKGDNNSSKDQECSTESNSSISLSSSSSSSSVSVIPNNDDSLKSSSESNRNPTSKNTEKESERQQAQGKTQEDGAHLCAGFRGIHEDLPADTVPSKTLILTADSHPAGADFELTDLTGVRVILAGHLGALRLNRVTRSTVLIAAVAGSVFMDSCRDCAIYAASRQMRIHGTHGCDLYLAIASRPIIEHCGTLRFAPDALEAPGRAALVDDAGLSTALLTDGAGEWCNVDDFRWLKRQQSPNWSIIPEEERKTESYNWDEI